jgi:hypothetical protein
METHGMHPDPHPLDPTFEPSGNPSGSAPGSMHRDAAVEEFNAFFEKLSSLDHLQWSAEPQAAAPAGASAPRPAAASAARKAAPASAKPRMTVLNPGVDAGAPEPALPPEIAQGRVTMRDVARFLKTTLVGLVLFALGLAAGWAALSLPGHFDQGMPSLTDLMNHARAVTLPRFNAGVSGPGGLQVVQAGQPAGATSPASEPAAALGPQAPATGAPGVPQSATAKAAGPAAPVAKSASGVVDSDAEHTDPDAGIQLPKLGDMMVDVPAAKPKAATAKAAKPKSATPKSAAAGPSARTAAAVPATQAGQPAAASGAGAATAATPAGATPAAGAGAAEPQFSLQVGACSSYGCVEAYRKLLVPKVNPRSIKVLTQHGAPGAASIQRVRIQPLPQAEAERLKTELAAQDPRFKGAYVIALH